MGHQLYAVVYKEERIKGYTNAGKPIIEKIRRFRAPTDSDDVTAVVTEALALKLPLWHAQSVAPDEEIDALSNYDRGHRMYGMNRWRDLFSPRQLYGHCVAVEVFRQMVAERVRTDLDRAAMAYLALAIDKFINYNSVASRWDSVRVGIRGKFDQHNFNMQWSYGEMAPAVTGFGHRWALDQTGKALRELVELVGNPSSDTLDFQPPRPKPPVRITCGSADTLPLDSASVDCIVMDPPYYDNVMYAELSDYFYVWLKRTAGLLYPELFAAHLTDKDREAVANAAKFAGQKGGAKNLAGLDYQRRMASIFREQRRILKPDGIMTVMFTHKAAGAWDALAAGLIDAGFTITASWPLTPKPKTASTSERSRPLDQRSSWSAALENPERRAPTCCTGKGRTSSPPSCARQGQGVSGSCHRRNRSVLGVLRAGPAGVY
jgi:adenine-specific DNA methylase